MGICPKCSRTNREVDALYCSYCGAPIKAKIAVTEFDDVAAKNCVVVALGELNFMLDSLKSIKNKINLICFNLENVSNFLGKEDFESLWENWKNICEDALDQLDEFKDFVVNTKKDLESMSKKYDLVKTEDINKLVSQANNIIGSYGVSGSSPYIGTITTGTSDFSKQYKCDFDSNDIPF